MSKLTESGRQDVSARKGRPTPVPTPAPTPERNQQPTPEQVVAEAQRALDRGVPELAEATCREVLDQHRDVPAAWYMIGKAAMGRGDLDEALDALAHAAALRPAFAPFRIALGEAQAAAGHARDALTSYCHATRLDPANGAAWLQRGKLELELGLKDRSLLSTRTGTRRAVSASKAALRYRTARIAGLMRNAIRAGERKPAELIEAEAAVDSGIPALATARLRAAMAQRPEHPEVAPRLSRALNDEGSHAAALECCEAAAARQPPSAALDLERARALAGLARLAEAVPLAQAAADALPADPGALCVLAEILRQDTQLTERRALLQRALELDPNHPQALRGMAAWHADAGDKGGVATWAGRALSADPGAGGMWYLLARAGGMTLGDPMGERLATLVRTMDEIETGRSPAYEVPPQLDRAMMRFAMFRLLDRDGRYEAAFDQLEQANALVDLSFCPDTHWERLARLRAVFDTDFFRRRSQAASPAEAGGIQPVFIVGMPRSGTSLTEQILASHPNVFGAGELNFFNDVAARLGGDRGDLIRVAERFAALSEAERTDYRTRYLAMLTARAPADCRYAVDKMPSNFLHLGMIATLFPDAPVLHCRRDPMDTCFSIYSLHFSGTHGYAYDLRTLGGYYSGYASLMAHWGAVLPNPLHSVFYEETVRDQEGQTRRLLARLGLPWREEVLSFHETERPIATSSSFQVRQPIYGSAVGRWKAYEDRLQPLAETLRASDV